MPYCQGKTMGRVNFKYPGKDWDNVVSRNPPIEYELIEGSAGAGRCPVAYNLFGSFANTNLYAGGCNSIRTWTAYAAGPGFRIIQYSSYAYIENDAGALWPLVGQAATLQGIIYSETCGYNPNYPMGWQFVIERVERADGQPDNCGSGEGCTFKVTDATGKIFERTESTCPEVYVTCGDECPPGMCKCPSDAYPGYCCLDCSSVAASLRQIANQARSI